VHGVYTIDKIERCTLNTIVHSYITQPYKAGAYTENYIVTLESIQNNVMHTVILYLKMFKSQKYYLTFTKSFHL